VDVAEGPGLLAAAEDGEAFAAQGLHDEVRYDAAIVRAHARAVGVEDAADLDLQGRLPVVVEEQRLGRALALVVAGPGTGWIDVAPVAFRLRMHQRVAVDFGGRGLQDRDGAL